MITLFDRIIGTAAAAVVAIAPVLTSCDSVVPGPGPLYEGDYVLSSQDEVNAFQAHSSLNSLIIEGEDITDLTSLDVKAAGSVTIRNTGITDLVLDNLSSVSTVFSISANPKLESISSLGLKFCIGDVEVEDNPVLTDISGFLSLKKMSGRFTVTGNSVLGEDKADQPDTYGLNVIKYLISNAILDIDKVTLSNNHPKAATDPSLIGQGESEDGVYSYEIKSDAEAAALNISSGIVKNLTISGENFTNAGLVSLSSKIKTVQGTVTIDGAAITTTEQFFEKIDCQGSIILRNLENSDTDGTNRFFNTNGFKAYTHIKGDLVLENIPYLVHWGPGNGFAQITQVDGDLTIRNSGMQQLAFNSLERVGGTFTLDHNCIELYTGFLWNLSTNLTYIGNDLVYTDNDHINGLAGLEKITHIGGNVTITGNGTDPSAGGILFETGNGRIGFDLVQSWIDNGVVSPDAVIICKYADGTDVEFNAPEPEEYKSYVIKGRDELLAFAPEDGSAGMEIVQDLTVLGNGDVISDNDMSFLKLRVEKVAGNLTVDGISGLTTTENMLETNGSGFRVEGSIIFRNCPELMNLNAFRFVDTVGGDLVFENCPKIATTWGSGQCLSLIESIGGDLTITGVQEAMSGLTFEKLKTVGGSMTVSGNNGNFWNFQGMAIESIGGNLTIADNGKVNGLAGFESLKKVGGNLTVTGNGSSSDGYIPVETTQDQVGLDMLGDLYRAGVFSADARFEIESGGVTYDINEL